MRQKEVCMELVKILIKMKAVISAILEAEDLKYSAIKDMNITELVNENENESILIHQMEVLEIQRQDLVETLSLQVGFDPQLSVTEISQQFPHLLSSDILTLCKEMKGICLRLQVATDRNQYILKNNSDMLSHILDIASGSQGDQYNNLGITQDTSNSMLHVLDQLV